MCRVGRSLRAVKHLSRDVKEMTHMGNWGQILPDKRFKPLVCVREPSDRCGQSSVNEGMSTDAIREKEECYSQSHS